MGQQQLILIVLCTIIVGVAIAVGLVIFAGDSTLANRDNLMSDVTIIISNARAYYIRPGNLGGGNNSFIGYTIPLRISSTEAGTYTRALDSPTSMTITGYSSDNIDNYITAKITSANQSIKWDFFGDFMQ